MHKMPDLSGISLSEENIEDVKSKSKIQFFDVPDYLWNLLEYKPKPLSDLMSETVELNILLPESKISGFANIVDTTLWESEDN